MQQKVGPAAIAVVVVIVLIVVGIIGYKVFGPESSKTVKAGESSGNAAYDAYQKDPEHNGPSSGNYNYKSGEGGQPKGSPDYTRQGSPNTKTP
jgi:hypothetical protein